MSHTPEPWDEYTDIAVQITPDPNGPNVAILSFEDYCRARLCVNAVAGIADPEKFVHDARFYSHETVTAIVKERDELMINLGCALEQRDELLSALKALVTELADSDEEGLIEHAEPMIAARAAIAKVDAQS